MTDYTIKLKTIIRYEVLIDAEKNHLKYQVKNSSQFVLAKSYFSVRKFFWTTVLI